MKKCPAHSETVPSLAERVTVVPLRAKDKMGERGGGVVLGDLVSSFAVAHSASTVGFRILAGTITVSTGSVTVGNAVEFSAFFAKFTRTIVRSSALRTNYVCHAYSPPL